MNHVIQTDFGALEVIAGCMFAEKSETMIRRLRRAKYEKKRVAAVKPIIDDRYSANDIASHSGLTFTAVPVYSPKDILTIPDVVTADFVGIDEAQFFDDSIVEVCQVLVSQGKRVLVAGLDQDFTGRPFGAMPTLLAVADFVTKLYAACTVCGLIATKSQRIVPTTVQVVPGGASAYEARCRKHWSPEPVFSAQERAHREEMDG